MKATIDRRGNLEVRPESAMENYTMQRWYEDWRKGEVTLTLSWEDEREPSGYARKTIDP